MEEERKAHKLSDLGPRLLRIESRLDSIYDVASTLLDSISDLEVRMSNAEKDIKKLAIRSSGISI